MNNGFFKNGNTLEKAYFLSTSGASYIAQIGIQVSPEIVTIHPALDHFRQRLAHNAETNNQMAAVYDVMDAINFISGTDPFFPQGGTPNPVQAHMIRASKNKAHFGVQGGLTNAVIASLAQGANAQGLDNKVMNAMERELAQLDIAYRNSEDWGMINGNTGSNPLAFGGLATEVTAANGSLDIDLAGAALIKNDIESVCAVQGLQGVMPTMILANPLMIKRIKELYYNNVFPAAQQPNPYTYMSIPTTAGNLELVGDPHVPVTYVSADTYKSNIYILTESHNGVPLLYMDYLIPESILPDYLFHDGTNATSTGMGIYAVGTLVSRANLAQSVIRNAAFTIDGALNTTVTSLSSLIL